ncbi:hypothetical protein HPP92_013043 [Vanilla planifolia]|uniref:Uncharacterized protein n=1 Tax=Vanilla planifolia TaxID=51239 RepID=A0A835QTB4_VANPL|nr:hypothetical protein HPP92_013513 [Vanilla planifolia]KAG0478324.1 hypothetical protein HPP92_013043 [Vanilla planifolia]
MGMASILSVLGTLESIATTVRRGVSASASAAMRWPPHTVVSGAFSVFRWPEIDFSVFDQVIWPVVVLVETVALAGIICFYLAFCGCNF